MGSQTSESASNPWSTSPLTIQGLVLSLMSGGRHLAPRKILGQRVPFGLSLESVDGPRLLVADCAVYKRGLRW